MPSEAGPDGPVISAELGTDLAAAALVLARHFAAGATGWCVAPSWPEHGRHVAVEFVHPVIVGKRALPVVNVDGPVELAGLRELTRSDDVVIGIGPTGRDLAATLTRARAWGLTTMWIGAGPRPGPGAADHVLFTPGEVSLARHDGRVVILYHVLWELTHVCFEHPGLLEAVDDPERCEGPACTTCSDEGVLGEVVAVSDAVTATVRTERGDERVDTTLVGPVAAGAMVLVHAGTAIATVSDDAA